jgi:N-acetylglutamate synthase-like GNAT family acetyltransferase
MLRFESARPEDRGKLEVLLWENGMDYADPIGDFMLARQDDEIVGCGRIEDYPDVAMVRPLVVAESFRRRGIGRLLLKQILPDGKPAVIVARGESAGFYISLGFASANWQVIPAHQANECTFCPDRMKCRPQPMIYRNVQDIGVVP